MPLYRLHYITSLDLPELQPYRTLRRSTEHLLHGLFVAEGAKVVERFLRSTWDVISLLVTREWHDALLREVPEERLAGADVFVGEKELLETIVGFRMHQGVMGVGRVPREPSLHELIARLPAPHLLVALDGLVHAENVGVVVRNCAGLGAHGIIVGPTTASPYLRRAVRNSMGGIFKLPCLHTRELHTELASLKSTYGTRIIIADAAGGSTIAEEEFSGNCCIVLGNEDAGVSREVDELATGRVRIPMHNDTDSLNVAAAGAILLYDAVRKREGR